MLTKVSEKIAIPALLIFGSGVYGFGLDASYHRPLNKGMIRKPITTVPNLMVVSSFTALIGGVVGVARHEDNSR